MLELLKESLENCPIVDMGGYHYFIHPITDGIPIMKPDVLNEVLDCLEKIVNFDCDYLLASEAMGIPLVIPLALRKNIPYIIIRKRKYDLLGEVEITKSTGYSESHMYLNNIKKGDRVVIVDDVLSTGGTLKAIVDALKNTVGAEIVDIAMVFEKTSKKTELENEIGMEIKTLLKVDVKDGKIFYDDVL